MVTTSRARADEEQRVRSVVQLDDAVHQRVRLGILAVLNEVHAAEFTHLRQLLELSDGNLARHLAVLAEAGLVELRKDTKRSRPATWAHLTRRGRRAFAHELDVLRQIVDRHDTALRPSPTPDA